LAYNQANSFSTSTSDLSKYTSKGAYDTITTTSYKESLGLLSAMTSDLTTLKSNLQYMLNYDVNGENAVTDSDKEKAYAQLRTLAAGVDSIVGSFKLDSDTLLSGRTFELNYGSSTDLKMSLDNLFASDLKDYLSVTSKSTSSSTSTSSSSTSSDNQGLNLASIGKGAKTTISYDYLNTLRNSQVSLNGLDISSATASTGDSTHSQLTDGEYQVEVRYKGTEKGVGSSVYIEKLDGTVVDEADDVDLSGTGQMDLKFASGVTLSLEKTHYRTSTGGDKSDSDVSLYANLSYTSVKTFNLDDGTDTKIVSSNSVSVVAGSTLSGATGSVSVTANTASVHKGITNMTTGQYDLKVNYSGTDGHDSSLWLYNSSGTLISTRVVNLSALDSDSDGKVSVDMGTGMAVTLTASDFTSSDRTYDSYFKYTAKDNAYEKFDYDAYYDVINSALSEVEDQLSVVSDAKTELQSRYSTVQSAVKLAKSGTLSGSSSLGSILSGSSVSASSLFSSISGSSSSDSTTTVATATGNIFTALQSSISTLSSSKDYAVLALYYK
jgi:hypothetical protein